MKNKWIKETLEWVVCFIIAYAIYLVVNYFVGTIAGVKQSSMYPTAKEGDRVLITRRILFNKSLSRGDVVIVEAPIDKEENNSGTAEYEQRKGLSYFTYKVMGIGKKSYIKRIIGIDVQERQRNIGMPALMELGRPTCGAVKDIPSPPAPPSRYE